MTVAVIVKSPGVYACDTLHVGIECARVHKRIQLTISLLIYKTVYIGGHCLSRVKNIINKVGTKSFIVIAYTPLVLFIYGSVLYDGCKHYVKHCRR